MRRPDAPAELTSAQSFAETVSNDRGARVVLYQIPSRGSLAARHLRRLARRYVARRRAQRDRASSGRAVGGHARDRDAAEISASRRSRRRARRGVTWSCCSGTPLADPLSSVQFVKRRLLLAGLIALVVALLLGYAAASMLAQRIRRLERAADRIAGGRFDEPVVDRGNDEFGQLAPAFERMRQRLDELDHARREFIANASHELRTPLFSLGGFLELLDDEELDDATRREFVVTMREQVERLTKLATDLLDLSRLDAGRIRVESRARRPRQRRAGARGGVQAARRAARAPARDRGRRRAGRARRRAARAADRARAASRTRSSTRRAGAGRRPCLARRRHARLAVEDDGPGIPPEHVAHVFERFYRADAELGVRQRPRARDRARAGGGDGRRGHAGVAPRPDGGDRRAARRTGARSRPRFHVKTRPLPAAAVATVSRCAQVQSSSSPSSRGCSVRVACCCSRTRPAGSTARPSRRARCVVSTTTPTDRHRGSPRAPLIGNGFDPAAIYARTSPGVVTIYALFGAAASAAPGLRLRRLRARLRAHELARDHDRRRRRTSRCAGRPSVYVVFADGDRVPATIVGWDLFDDIGVLKLDPRDHTCSPRCRSATRTTSSSASPSRRSAARSASELARRRRRLGGVALDSVADLRVLGHGRDPDRRADQPRQLGRAAVRRRAAA